MRPPMWAHWRHLANTIELGAFFGPPDSTAAPKGKSICSAVSVQLTATLYFTVGDHFPKIAPFHGDLNPI